MQKTHITQTSRLPLTCLMFCPTYSITISSAAMGSMANRPQSWMCDLQNLIFFLRNCKRQTMGCYRKFDNILNCLLVKPVE